MKIRLEEEQRAVEVSRACRESRRTRVNGEDFIVGQPCECWCCAKAALVEEREAAEHPDRALSLRQPFAWMMFHGKTIENRARLRPKERGRFWIHASATKETSAGPDGRQYGAWARAWIADNIAPEIAQKIPPADELAHGMLLGVAQIVDVLSPECTPDDYDAAQRWFPRAPGDPPFDRFRHMREQNGIVVAGARAFARPLRCSGALGFFRIDPETAQLALARSFANP